MRKIIFLMVAAASVSAAWARSFSVVVYNVENLFDADGMAVYDDYQASKYTAAHLAVKLTGISKVLAKVDKGAGPDVIFFNEIEADQTPASTVTDAGKWLEKYAGKRFNELLAESPMTAELTGVPSEIWLQKALWDEGLRGYNVVSGDDRSGSIAVKCVLFSRFPVKKTRLHPIQNARPIVEAELDVNGQPLYVFNNHWKSGAGDVKTEADRRANARTLRVRLDQILAADPNADIIIGGDLNSQYNQKVRYRDMGETGINDILGSQGNELAIRGKERDLYNLWFELPSDARGSDVFKGEWGTLVHLILSRGLYDMRGVQYEDGSFAVMKITGFNADSVGLPNRWKPYPAPGSGFSDHFPLYARFRTVDDNRTDRWMPLTKPTTDDSSSTLKIDYAPVDLFKHALKPSELPKGADMRDGSYNGKIFYISAKGYTNDKGHVKVKIGDLEYDVFSHQKEIRDLLRNDAKEGKTLHFYGELGTFKGNWQFVVQGKEWVK
jgi:endonuclease/exonuclease/phosphatase family metal-dependent hydrolase